MVAYPSAFATCLYGFRVFVELNILHTLKESTFQRGNDDTEEKCKKILL